jgi:hypothetical protein
MVSSIYTPNKRIDYYRNLSRALMPKQIRAYDPNIRNPYAQTAGTNLANVLSGLVQTYSAQQQLGKAERLETAQKGAQRAIGGKLAALGIPSDQPILRTDQIETEGLYGGISPQMSLREMAFDTPQFTAEQMETAGVTPLPLQERIAGIRAAREKTYTARRKGEIENRLSAVSQAQVLDPENRALFDESQQLRALLDPAEFAKEASAEQAKIRAGERAEAYRIKTAGRLLKTTLAREERDLGRKVNADEKDAIKWRFQYELKRTDQTAAQIATEERRRIRDEAAEKTRLGRDLDKEERDHLEFIAREEFRLKTTLSAEQRADLKTKNREYRAILRTLDGEKRAVATAIDREERRLNTTLSAEDRARIARDLRAQFDDDRADVRAIAAAKRKRVDVYDVGTGDKFSITQEQMDSDQEGQAPTYKYGKPDKGRVDFVHFEPNTAFTVGGQKYIPGQTYQVTQDNIRANADLRNAIETQSDVVKPRQLDRQRVEPKEQPLRPLPPPKQMVKYIEEASAGDLFGIFKSAVDGFMSFFMFADVYPETRDAKEALEIMRTTMRVPLVKALSERGSVFTIQQINKILPSSGKTDAQNMALIRNLIPTYYDKLEEAEDTLLNTKLGSKYNVAAAKTVRQINSLLPNLRAMADAWDNRKQLGAVPSEGEIRLPSGVTVRRVTGRSSSGSVSPTVPTDQ